jgi:hypothetical protein
MSLAFLVGRFLFCVPFVMVGANDVVDPGPDPRRRGLGALGVIGAAMVILGAWGDVGALVLVVQALLTTLAGRREGLIWALDGLGLVGGALVVFAVYAGVGHALDYTVTDPWISLDLR